MLYFSAFHNYVCNKRSHCLRGKKGAGNGKDSEKKKDKTEPKQQLEEGVEDNADEYDIEEDSQIVDFDKLMDKLKNEKKLVEIGNPQATRRNQVFRHAFYISLLRLVAARCSWSVGIS